MIKQLFPLEGIITKFVPSVLQSSHLLAKLESLEGYKSENPPWEFSDSQTFSFVVVQKNLRGIK
jgi:hypothetical protein